MSSNGPSRDLTRTILAVLFIGGLITASFWVLRPFLLALIWATTIVVATWPIMRSLQSRIWGRRGLAVALMTIFLLLVLIVPLLLAIGTIVENAQEIADLSRSLTTVSLPPPPGWVQNLPIIGERLVAEWQQTAAAGPEALSARISPYATKLLKWFVSQAGSVGAMLVEFLLTVIIAAILYTTGETASSGVIRFARRLAGERGETAVCLAGQAIRAVALGVVVTALVQSVLAGIGLQITGIPYAAVLTAVMFMLCIAQIGPGLVLVPSVIWLYWSGDTLWGTVLLVWSVVVMGIDNFLRPILIKKGADLPLLLIFAGVIGGLIAFGIIGLFIGPVVLSVTYTLLASWMEDGQPKSAPPASSEGS